MIRQTPGTGPVSGRRSGAVPVTRLGLRDALSEAVAGILPSLPEVKAVVTQGGDGYGAAQAFKAAGRPTPLIIMGNRQDELAWWKEQKDANGYETMAVSIAPGEGM